MTDQEQPATPRPAFRIVNVFILLIPVFLVLAVLFYPSPKVTAREKARQMSCISNQKQLALAILMFVQENQETLPGKRGAADTSWYATGPTAVDVDPDIMNCRSAGRRGDKDYGYNRALYGMAMDVVPIFTKTILTADSDNANNCLISSTDIAARHNGGTIATFVDGHTAYGRSLRTMLNQSATADNPWILQGGSNVIIVDAKGACTFKPGSTPNGSADYVAVQFQGTAAPEGTICGQRVTSPGVGGTIVIHADGTHALHRVVRDITAKP